MIAFQLDLGCNPFAKNKATVRVIWSVAMIPYLYIFFLGMDNTAFALCEPDAT